MTHAVWLLCLIPLTSVTAQAELPPLSGERVRVYTSRGTFEGAFQSIDSTVMALRLTRGDSVLTLPLQSTARLSVQRGTKPASGRGATAGGAAGAVVGTIAAVATAEDCEPGVDPACLNPAVQAVVGAVLGAVVGAGLGALIGSTLKEERWVDVPLDQLRINWVPGTGEVRLRWQVRF